MSAIASDALVLRTLKLGETSKIVVLLTRERGKVRAVAKGARGPRSRYHSSLEPLSEVRVELHGRQGTDLYRLGQCELVRSAFPAGDRGLETALSLSYFAELLDAFSQEGEAEDAAYRLAVAIVRAAEDGVDPAALARYLEAWLLKLHGLYPPLDRCAACGGLLPRGALRYHRAAHGFVCDDCGPASGPVLPEGARAFVVDAFRRAPAAMTGVPAEAAVLESFHQDLITNHLERALRSQRVMRDVARETRER
ncbi:MAG: DNA repair protein RecO [Acidobacteria bacterium]|nr:DNA repair protein RecO [Acidobacteriota bacterium]